MTPWPPVPGARMVIGGPFALLGLAFGLRVASNVTKDDEEGARAGKGAPTQMSVSWPACITVHWRRRCLPVVHLHPFVGLQLAALRGDTRRRGSRQQATVRSACRRLLPYPCRSRTQRRALRARSLPPCPGRPHSVQQRLGALASCCCCSSLLLPLGVQGVQAPRSPLPRSGQKSNCSLGATILRQSICSNPPPPASVGPLGKQRRQRKRGSRVRFAEQGKRGLGFGLAKGTRHAQRKHFVAFERSQRDNIERHF